MDRNDASPPSNLLRKTGDLALRSVYAAEWNWAVTTEHLEAAMFLRGAAMSAFGYMDVRMGKLAIRLSRIATYHALRQNFPRTIEQRVLFFRQACEIAPPSRLISHARSFLDRLEAQLPLRHQIAHAQMRVQSIGGLGYIEFEDFPQGVGIKPPEVPQRRDPIQLVIFEQVVRRLAQLSRYGQSLNDALLEWDGLPTE